MRPFIIGIAGGSGSGKTALAEALRTHSGKRTAVLHMDNYQRFGQRLPLRYGMKNWDHPAAVDWIRLLKDLGDLKRGKTIIIAERNQQHLQVSERPKKFRLKPQEIIIVDGYLLFHNPAVRRLLDFRVFLRAGRDIRVQRRTKFKNPAYIKKVLLPMHDKYIEPTRRFADLVLPTARYTVRRCLREVLQHLPKHIRV